MVDGKNNETDHSVIATFNERRAKIDKRLDMGIELVVTGKDDDLFSSKSLLAFLNEEVRDQVVTSLPGSSYYATTEKGREIYMTGTTPASIQTTLKKRGISCKPLLSAQEMLKLTHEELEKMHDRRSIKLTVHEVKKAGLLSNEKDMIRLVEEAYMYYDEHLTFTILAYQEIVREKEEASAKEYM